VDADRSLEFIDQDGLQASGIKIDQASCYFFIARAVEAKLTHAYGARFGKHRRAKASASDRTRRVEITGTGFRVERRTGVVIAEVGKLSGLARAIANGVRALRIVAFEFRQTLPQAPRIQLSNFEWPVTALRATRPANQP
jgi:hypothetical protein